MNVFAMTTVRDESFIISDTLDCWGEIAIEVFVYGDDSRDATPSICRTHPKVREYLTSNLYDPDRERMEWYKRQALFNSLKRFCEQGDWICLFDADEHLDFFRPEILQDDSLACIHCRSWDFYITPEDEHLDREELWCPDYRERQWVSPQPRQFPFFIRFDPRLRWWYPNQHNPDRDKQMGETVVHGSVKHWGKGYSKGLYDRKKQYYAEEWGTEFGRSYAGNDAIKEDYTDDHGNPLIKYEDIVHV